MPAPVKKIKKQRPNFSFERAYDGFVCGLDEVGRAPLAGPVVAACVYIEKDKIRKRVWSRVNDSKTIPAALREELDHEIRAHSFWGIGEACHSEIETLNIVHASFLAMRRAYGSMCKNYNVDMGLALIDGHLKPLFPCSTQPIVRGDSRSVSIAAASIIAKVYRDRLMAGLAAAHPHYGWERNAGYPTKAHLAGIESHGLTPYHRKSFSSVRNFLEFGTVRPPVNAILPASANNK